MARFGRVVLVSAVLLLALGLPHSAPADVTVNTTDDVDTADGACSLREAIVAANTNASYNGCIYSGAVTDTIAFALGSGTPSITITGSNLPALVAPTIIDGATGGATRVEITGGGSRDTGISFGGGNGSGSIVRNLVINGFTGRQLFLSNASGIVVEGNLLGLDPGGTFVKGNSGRGIEVCSGFGCGTSQSHQIGGPTPAQRNVIASVNGPAIDLGGNGVVIQGNFVNTDAAGTANLAGPFVSGIVASNVFNTKIGGDQAGEGNVIVGFNAIALTGNPAGSRTTNTVIQGNFIGTNVAGTASLQSGGSVGVAVAHAEDTLIGGTTAGAGNLISGSQDGIAGGSSGVSGAVVTDTTVQGNRIGTDASGTGPLGNSGRGIALGDAAIIENNVVAFNGGIGISVACGACVQTISGNEVFSNGDLGIDLGGNGPTDNDLVDGDPDGGPNGLQNFPVLDNPVFAGGAMVTGTLNSTPGRSFRVEIFSNTTCDPSLRGEGQTFVGAADTATTDGNGDVSFLVTLAQALPATLLTATATDLTTGATSELSDCPVPPPTPTATPTATVTATPTPGAGATITPTPTPTMPVAGVPLGHFLGSQAKVAKSGPKFFKLGPVTLADAASGYTAGFDVLKPTLLAVPANKNGEGFTDAVTHLTAYAIKVAKGSAKFATRADVGVANQCGSLVLTLKKPVSLLVPTGVNVAEPAPHEVDHFLCYQAKMQRKLVATGVGVPTLPKAVQVDVAVGASAARRYDLKKVVSLCLPVAKSGSPKLLAGPNKGQDFTLAPAAVGRPGALLVCYAAKLATKTIAQNGCGPATPGDKGTKIVPKQTKAAPQLGVQIGNQLGAAALDTKKETLICIPSASDT